MRLARALVIAAALAGLARTAAAQEPPPSGDLTGVVRGEGFTRIPLAIPEAETDAAARQAGLEILDTLRDDLEFSGFFELIDPERVRLAATSKEKTEALRWASVGAKAVVATAVAMQDKGVRLQARVLDTAGGATLFNRVWRESPDRVRRLAHQLADDIVQHFTGRSGVALTRIAFVSKYGKGKELYVMDYDGARLRRFSTTGTINLSPVWSPTADRLAFVSWRSGQPGIYILEEDGRLVRAPTVGGELNSTPAWSPDGRKIAYTADADGNAEIYVADLVAKTSRRLTFQESIETSPDFSPNGRELAFTSDRSGSPQVYVMDLDGLNVRRISQEGPYNESPAWSPRGDKIAYTSRIDGHFQIVVYDVATGKLAQLTSAPANSEDPRWSPDGRHIVYSSNRSGSYDIYTMDADGGRPRRLSQGGDSFTPDWSMRP